MDTEVLNVTTGSEPAVVDLTGQVASFVRTRGDGLVNVFAPHATAGVAIIEVGAGSERDLLSALGDLLPTDDRWTHRHGSYGHGRDHVMPALVSPSMSVPVQGGALQLGTWQSIVLVDPNRDNAERKVLLSFISA